MSKYNQLKIQESGHITYVSGDGGRSSANLHLAFISMAWHAGCNMEDLADGYGKGLGTCGGDWSGIRDSSDEATEQMLERALNYIDTRLKGNEFTVAVNDYEVGVNEVDRTSVNLDRNDLQHLIDAVVVAVETEEWDDLKELAEDLKLVEID
jgi:hypothetical protein